MVSSLSPQARAWLQIHGCVVLWGFTAILGKLITVGALPLVWWRTLVVSCALALLPRFWSAARKLSWRQIWIVAGIGAGVSVHWLTFYGAVKLANASVAATCMALNPVFLSLLEPWLTGKRVQLGQVLLGVGVLPGVILVVGGVPSGMHLGIATGVFSSLCIAVFSALNKRFAVHEDALAVTGIQMSAGLGFITLLALVPGLPDVFALPSARDFGLLVLLALVFTLLPYLVLLITLRELSAFAATLAVNLEPIYAILLAMLFFDEQRELSGRFYLGAGIILASVFAAPWLSRTRGALPASSTSSSAISSAISSASPAASGASVNTNTRR